MSTTAIGLYLFKLQGCSAVLLISKSELEVERLRERGMGTPTLIRALRGVVCKQTTQTDRQTNRQTDREREREAQSSMTAAFITR